MMNEVIKAIENASDTQINEIINAVTRRYERLYPDWEVVFYSISREPKKRRTQKWQLLRMIWKYT